MTGETNMALNIIGDVESRRGVYANAVLITSQESDDILDFIFTDGEDENGNPSGVLATRVIMTRSTLLRLKDTIEQHIDKGIGGRGE